MPTFVYSPEVRVHVAADGTNIDQFRNKQFDISDDLVQGSVIIRTNGVHTFNFQLQNAQRKYDGVLQPMDRITVEMKRVTWVRVFSGYLNNGPIFSAWPRVLNMSASCTLKRLQFWYWDPTTSAAGNLLLSGLNAHGTPGIAGDTPVQQSPVAPGVGNTPGTVGTARESIRVGAPVGAPADTTTTPIPGTGTSAAKPGTPQDGQGGQTFDDNIKGVVMKILNDVVGWPQDKVHIGAIPDNWVKLATEVGNLILQKSDVGDLIGDLSKGNQTTLSQDAAMGATTQDQIGIIKIICDVARQRFGADARQAAILGVACGLVETELRNLPGGDRDSVGVFQQRPSQGWGTVEQCTNVTYAAGKFFSKFPGDWKTRSPGPLIQSIQRSAFPDKYATRMAEATTKVDQNGGF